MNPRPALILLIPLMFTRCKPAASSPGKPEPAAATAPTAGEAPNRAKPAPTEPGLIESIARTHRNLEEKMEAKNAAKEVAAAGTSLLAWTLDHEGAFPPDLETLAREGNKYGFTPEALAALKPGVIEYLGHGLSNSDDGNLVLLRYRPGRQTSQEVRLFVNAACRVVPSDTPIPKGDEPRN